MNRLGAEYARNLSWPDCIYRTVSNTDKPCYPTEESIFGEIHPGDRACRYSARTSFVFHEPTIIYAPLGVGHHIDHQLVRNLGIARLHQRDKLPAKDLSVALEFYEEYPYIRDIMATQRALDILRLVAPDMRLEPVLVELNEADIQAKVEAIAYYQSQTSSFWPDLNAMEKDVQATFMRSGRGVPAERYWRVISEE